MNDLDLLHPAIRAGDWKAALILRLLGSSQYADLTAGVVESSRVEGTPDIQSILFLCWRDSRTDVDRCAATYQEHIITEFAALAIACIVTYRSHKQVTEVCRRGQRADYWLGEKESLLEVSGQLNGDLDTLCREKTKQLKSNPWGKGGFVCVVNFAQKKARIWYCA